MKFLRKHLCLVLALGWILGIHQGFIALWEENATEPAAVYPHKASLLPPAEEQLLRSGIRIQDEAHLQFLLMNYLS